MATDNTPESGACQMTAKDRYRLQRKLGAALTRVVESLATLGARGITPNGKNLILMAGLCSAFVRFGQPFAPRAPAQSDFDPFVIHDAAEGAKRRRHETTLRKGRKVGCTRPKVIRLPWKQQKWG
jgi:hypothetical protein